MLAYNFSMEQAYMAGCFCNRTDLEIRIYFLSTEKEQQRGQLSLSKKYNRIVSVRFLFAFILPFEYWFYILIIRNRSTTSSNLRFLS